MKCCKTYTVFGVCCRSAGVHWCPRIWPDHVLPAFNLLAVGQEAKNHKLAFLGLLGMYHCWSHHHSFGGCWRAQRHHCRCIQLQVLHLSLVVVSLLGWETSPADADMTSYWKYSNTYDDHALQGAPVNKLCCTRGNVMYTAAGPCGCQP